MDATTNPCPAAVLVVCTTCRRPVADDGGADAAAGDGASAGGEAPRPGARMLAALAAAGLPPGVALRPAECLSVCGAGCAVALTGPGKWSYVYGGLDPATHAAAILEGAARYAAAPEGIVPWRDRPEIFRRQSVARIPPPEPAHEP